MFVIYQLNISPRIKALRVPIGHIQSLGRRYKVCFKFDYTVHYEDLRIAFLRVPAYIHIDY